MSPYRLHECETFVEFKTLASLTITQNAIRAPRFTQVLKSHGRDGRYFVLVVSLLANLSDDFMVLSDFLGLARALKVINRKNISPKHALAMNRHILVSHFGHLASLVWAKLILGGFCDSL